MKSYKEFQLDEQADAPTKKMAKAAIKNIENVLSALD